MKEKIKIFNSSNKRISCQSEIDYMISCVEDSIKWRKITTFKEDK